MVGDLKELNVEIVASQIETWDDEIEHLDSRADILVAQIEDSYYQMIGSLRSKEKELKEQLALLKATSENDESWLTARDRLVRNAECMKDAIFYAINKVSTERRRQIDEEASISAP